MWLLMPGGKPAMAEPFVFPAGHMSCALHALHAGDTIKCTASYLYLSVTSGPGAQEVAKVVLQEI